MNAIEMSLGQTGQLHLTRVAIVAGGRKDRRDRAHEGGLQHIHELAIAQSRLLEQQRDVRSEDIESGAGRDDGRLVAVDDTVLALLQTPELPGLMTVRSNDDGGL